MDPDEKDLRERELEVKKASVAIEERKLALGERDLGIKEKSLTLEKSKFFHDAVKTVARWLIGGGSGVAVVAIVSYNGLASIVKDALTPLNTPADYARAFGAYTLLVTYGLISTAAWWFQRKGKKRCISEKGKLQAALEADDPGRSSSSLSPDGTSPRRSQ